MTEQQLRQNMVATFESWLGRKESDGSHKMIIDIYNSHSPLARGYKVKYTDSWCATAVSSAAIENNLTDIIPTECGCGEQIKLYQSMGRWMENDWYVPNPGDQIFYDWDDNGKGDNTGWPEHTGLVVSVTNGKIKVIEGNKGDAVAYREIDVDGKNIRGYGLPDYASKAKYESQNPVEYTIYIVKQGDTLYGLAEKYLGNGGRYDEIMTLNGLTSTTIIVGQELKIPGTVAEENPVIKVNPYPVPTRSIKYIKGQPTMVGEDVKWVQWNLIQEGHNIELDGRFGPASDSALRAYQKAHNLEVDGSCGPATRSCMLGNKVTETPVAPQAPVNTSPSYQVGKNYTLQVEVKVRKGPGTNYGAKSHSELTSSGQSHDSDKDGALDKGTVVTCQEVRSVGSDIWIRCPSGWVAAYYSGKEYIK